MNDLYLDPLPVHVFFKGFDLQKTNVDLQAQDLWDEFTNAKYKLLEKNPYQ